MKEEAACAAATALPCPGPGPDPDPGPVLALAWCALVCAAGMKAQVLSLARAGEDGARFKLTDLDSTLSSFAGADYDLQDAISGATNKTTVKREADGNEFYEYDIESPVSHHACMRYSIARRS